MWIQQAHIGDDYLVRAIDEELSPRQQRIVRVHVARCAACRSRMSDLRATLTEVTALCQSNGDATGATSVARLRLEGALRADAGRHPRSSASARAWFIPGSFGSAAAGFAAALMLTVAILAAATWRSDDDGAHGALPLAAVTPGAVSDLTVEELCAGVRPSRVVTAADRERVLRDYRMEHVDADAYELDALITPELGGTTDPANLWPQRYAASAWNARVKDEIENLLPGLVCSGQVPLARAQQEIASDWIEAYKRYFDTDVPLRAHMEPARQADETDELILAPVQTLARLHQ